MRRLALPLSVCPLITCALVSCTQDSGVAVHNNPPEVAFVLPADGSWGYAGVPMEFIATITDDLTANSDLSFQWTSTLDGYLTGEESVEGETLSLLINEGLSVGDHVITLQVVDEQGDTAEDTLNVELVLNNPPDASIIKPAANTVYEQGEAVEFLGYFQDVEDMENLDLLAMTWEGTVDLTDAPEFGDSTGRARFTIYDIAVGDYTVAYEVVDLAGDTSSASVNFSVE